MTAFEWVSTSIALLALVLQFVQGKKDRQGKDDPS